MQVTLRIYDVIYSCNACGASYSNKISIKDSIDSIICEAETVCEICGHEDYWAYGHFMSNQYIKKGKAKKY